MGILEQGSFSIPELSEILGAQKSDVTQAISSLTRTLSLATSSAHPLIRYTLFKERQITKRQNLLEWSIQKIEQEESESCLVRLAELVNRRGLYQANQALHLKAVKEVLNHLQSNGILVMPDYSQARRSPGIGTIVAISLETNATSSNPRHQIPEAQWANRAKLGLVLAKADGVVSDSEVLAVQDQAVQRLGNLSDQEQHQLREAVTHLRSTSLDIDGLVEQLRSTLRPHEQQRLIEELFDVAMADGVFHEQERVFLRKLHESFGTASEHFESLIKATQAAPESIEEATDSSTSAPESPGESTKADVEHREIGYLLSLLSTH